MPEPQYQQFEFTLSGENLYFTEALARKATKALSTENLYFVEAMSRKSTCSVSEAIYLVEASTRKLTKASLPESLYLVEDMSYVYSSGFGGIINFDYTQSAAEDIYFTEAMSKKVTQSTGENVYLVEAISRKSTKPVSDNLYLVEAMTRLATKPASENLYLVEAWSRLFQGVRSISEDIYLAETLAKRLTRPVVSENIFLVEAMSYVYTAWTGEIGGIINFDYTQSASESFLFAETFSLTSRKTITEVVYLSEIASLRVSKSTQEAVSLSETAVPSIWKAVADVLYVSEAVHKWVTKGVSEDVYLSETFSMIAPSPTTFDDYLYLSEGFNVELYAETIKEFERPYINYIGSTPQFVWLASRATLYSPPVLKDIQDIPVAYIVGRNKPLLASLNKKPIMKAVRGFQEGGG